MLRIQPLSRRQGEDARFLREGKAIQSLLNKREGVLPLSFTDRILLVDDEAMTSYALKDHLEQQGYRVTVAQICQEAKDILASPVKVDLVILDYLLPDGRGTDLLASMGLESSLQKPRGIMSSCVIEPESASWEAVRLRLPDVSRSLIKAYVNKPYTFDSMDAVVNLILSVPARNLENTKEVHSGDYEPLYPSSTSRQAPRVS